MADAFDSKRARALSSRDQVLFIYNYENDTYINNFEVEIDPPSGSDASGRTKVVIRGKGEIGPRGNGGYTGEVNFFYRRTPLNLLELPTDGTFYTFIREEVGFLSIVDEVARRTGFNLSYEDFVDEPFNALSMTGYVLKAHPDSFRFEGEINLAMPLRKDLASNLPFTDVLSFPDSDAQLSLLITRQYIGLDLTPWPALITEFKVGRKVGLADDVLLAALRQQTGVGSLDLRIGPGSFNRLNIYQAEVIYNGLLRDEDMRPYHKGLDSVIVFKPAPNYSDGALGNLSVHYNSKAVVKRYELDSRVYMLQMMGSENSGTLFPATWAKAKAGQFIEQIDTYQQVSLAFESALGIGYEPTYGKDLIVDYNGPVTNEMPLPNDDTSYKVVRLRTAGGVNNLFQGSTYIYY